MDYYKEIKKELLDNEINRRVKNYSINKSDLNAYFKVGKILNEAGRHYGEGIIKEYSKRLTKELGKGYTETNLRYYRLFYDFAIHHTVCDELTWSHYRLLISMTNNEKINYYVYISKVNNLSVRQLKERIKNNEYERLPETTKKNLDINNESNIKDLIKNPIIIKNSNNYDEISEKLLQKLILEDLPSFMKELGEGFCFIDNEYSIKLGQAYNYIDLLLFNIKYNCYVVVELKVTELKKEHIGQIEVYMNYIDNNLRLPTQDKTIGIIICKQDNKYVIKYCSDSRIISREYKLI